MKLSTAAELAIKGILDLAERHGQGPVPLEQTCQRRGLPRQYLTKIFSMLARANLVTPIRGKGGGYVLARDPRDILLLEVVEAIEGPLAVNHCTASPPRCQEPNCQVRPVWAELQQQVRQALAARNLAELISLPQAQQLPV